MTAPRVVVVGGGISGLACAFTLLDDARRRGHALDLTVLDAGARPGGHAQTVLADGFVVESGPNGFLNREPHTLALADALGLTPRLVEARPEAKRRFIVRDGRLCQVPEGPLSLFTSPALSWRGKLRLAAEPWAPGPPDGADETVHAFATRRIGAEAAEMLVDAAVSGISAGDSRRLSVQAQFPMMTDMERAHGSLVRAMFARKKDPSGPSRLLSLDTGMGALTGALADALGDRVQSGVTVQSVAPHGGAWRVMAAGGAEFLADHVVLAVPARVAAPMVAAADTRLAMHLADIEYAGLAVVALAYRVLDIPRPLDGYGYLITRPECLATLGVVWESSLFPRRAPEGWALLRVMVGGARRPDVLRMADADLLALARQELRRVLGVTAAPAASWVFSWPEAIAQYTVGHRQRRQAIADRAAAHDGLTLCGTAYDGVSFNHAVKSARLSARAVAERVWRSAPVEASLAGVDG